MPKHQKHTSEKEMTAALPLHDYALVKTLISEKDWQEWAIDELSNGGPRHKQAYSALLLSRMHELVQALEKSTKSRFSAQPGKETESLKDDVTIPIPLPFTAADKDSYEAVGEALSHSPAHEIIAFNALLQSIEWSINTLSAKTSA